MGADDTLRVDPQVMRGSADALGVVVEGLLKRLTELDGQVGEMLGGWRGASGTAYSSAWELWHRGAGEVHAGLGILARLIDHAAVGYDTNEARSVREMQRVGHG